MTLLPSPRLGPGLLALTLCLFAILVGLFRRTDAHRTTQGESHGPLPSPSFPKNAGWPDRSKPAKESGVSAHSTNTHNQSHTPFRQWQTLESAWHPRLVAIDDLIPMKALQPGRLEVVQHPDFGTSPILMKIADAHEAKMYRLLSNLGVTPQFLGHVTEGVGDNHSVIGFITEYVQPRRSAAKERKRTITRREACLAALRQIHRHGIAHGDAHEGNCLARGDGTAVLVDFELSLESGGRAEFDRDLWIMDHTVED